MRYLIENGRTMVLALSIICSFVTLGLCQKSPNKMSYTNSIEPSKMLIVIAPPSIKNPYYTKVYDKIIAFDVAYAKSIMDKDNVVVLVDKATKNYLKDHLPEDILLEQELDDIWLLDCSTLNPFHPVQFRYAAAAQGAQKKADLVQDKFNILKKNFKLDYERSNLILDGGNYVDNYSGRAIVSDRFLMDNNLSYTTAKQQLKKILQLKEVAIIPNDNPKGLAHADGQVMFIDDNTILVSNYNDTSFQKSIQDELEIAFPGIQILLMPTEFDHTVWDPAFSSSCGIHINSCMTKDYIYLPIFNGKTDSAATQLVKNNTSKTVVPIDASNVCMMGGSVRCLSWQLVGNNAKKLIEAARK